MGEPVVEHRSSWVRTTRIPSGEIFVKTYNYDSWRDRLRNWGKWTAPLRKSRAARECAALTWLREHNFAAPEPLACLEWRRLGFLCRATLVTESFAGQRCDYLLSNSNQAARKRILDAVTGWVEQVHALGFRDRNLDLRNLIVDERNDQIAIAKIDSPRFRLTQPGRAADRLARADWQRLQPQLAPYSD